MLTMEALNNFKDITLAGALIVAVAVLWRTLSRKDELILSSLKAVTEALALAAISNQELRKIIEASVRAKEELTDAIRVLNIELHAKPCMMVK